MMRHHPILPDPDELVNQITRLSMQKYPPVMYQRRADWPRCKTVRIRITDAREAWQDRVDTYSREIDEILMQLKRDLNDGHGMP